MFVARAVSRVWLVGALLLAGSSFAQDFDVSEIPRPASASDEFGAAVSAEAGFVAIGDPGANRVYVYRRDGDALILDVEIPLEEILVPADFTGNPRFGAAIDLAAGAYCLDFSTCPGHSLIIGAPDIEVVDIWTRNNPVVFPEDPAPLWEPVLAFITGDVAEDLIGDLFGTAVTLSDDSIFIGAPAAIPNGEVYVFSRDGSQFLDVLGPEGSLLSKGQNAAFGSSIAFKNGKLGIGAPNALGGAGAVSLFNAVAGNLNPAGTAMGSDGDAFGSSVSIDGSMVAAGTPGAAQGGGGAELFRFSDPDNSVTLAPPADLNNVGTSVALQGPMVIAGAEQQNGAPVAVLRSMNNANLEVRLPGNLVGGISEQAFVAADRSAGQVSAALDRDRLFSNGME